MISRQKEGSVVCPSCGRLVGVQDDACLNCGRKSPGLFGFGPALQKLGRDLGFVKFVMTACVLLFILPLALEPSAIRGGGIMNLLSPGLCPQFLLGTSGGIPIHDYGRWWTVLTAGWLHGSLIHIGFNLMWIRQLGPMVSKLYGPGRSIILYILSSVAGFAMTSGMRIVLTRTGLVNTVPDALSGALLTLGASAAIFGWLGALIVYGKRTGQTEVSRNLLVGTALPLFFIGFVFPGVDNWAHAGGFLGGYVLGRWMDPMQPERGNHLILALVLLAATALAFAAAILHGLPILETQDFKRFFGC